MTTPCILEITARRGKFYIYRSPLVCSVCGAYKPHSDKLFLWPDGKWHEHTCTVRDWKSAVRKVRRPGYFNSREAAQATLDRYLRRTSRS